MAKKKPNTSEPAKKKTTAAKKPSKTAAKPKTVKKPAKKPASAKKKPTPKPAKQAKKPTAKGAKKIAALVPEAPAAAPATAMIDEEDATPAISSPLNNAVVPAVTDLQVAMTTNRTDLCYLLVLTRSGFPPLSVPFNIAAPGSSPFYKTIPGSNLASGCTYTLRVYVDPADGSTPPHQDHTITITTS